MSEIEKFNELVQNTRRDDDYVNATEWCKAFGYTVKQWKQLPEVKRRAKALESVKILPSNFEGKKILLSNLEDEKILPWVVERVGKTWVTWVHPIMAVHLASYLDPAFANYVAEIFVRYVKADPHLAADIASRQETTEGLDIIDKAVKERYKFLEGRDWFYTRRQLSKVEKSYFHKKWQLPHKDFKLIVRYVDLSSEVDAMDFFKEKYPGLARLIHLRGTNLEDQDFLLSYFREEVEEWVRQKNAEIEAF